MSKSKHHMRKQLVRSTLGVLFVIAFSLLCWSAAYFITWSLYRKINAPSSDFAKYIINATLSFFIFGGGMFLFSWFVRPRQMAFFHSIIEALRRIAKGDFKVSLDVPGGPDNQFGELVNSINHMAQQLNQMEEMRQEFISNVSHEIQSPLTSIHGFARVLRNDKLNHDERLYYIGIIEAESMRLSKLSDNLLKLTSLESEHHPFVPKRYRLDTQLRHHILACEPQWRSKSIGVEASLEPTTIIADEDLMSQVWINLLHNSIKFTPDGGSITVELRMQGKDAIIRISDTGVGIPEEDLKYVFERFYKADKARNRAISGGGLGLAIVKKIITLHQGNVRVESRLQEGTTMTVTLPVEQAHP
ncbi:cell wall metabolism sensor histidine kinase WalK [Paenibacillus sp. J2TS4]|uniref:sensor histidine kinase n=1 Tax=Paenibacillus sp. J2TS4 TaxID=2807194 RepID=UPI001B03C904|nr:HAMP domain-containing sensor histidine kinase [Paenibacillus sp. J2TS4]GIP32039.1 two-component sensor histidine kinase [Paenibacillus sp. J2TS4]